MRPDDHVADRMEQILGPDERSSVIEQWQWSRILTRDNISFNYSTFRLGLSLFDMSGELGVNADGKKNYCNRANRNNLNGSGFDNFRARVDPLLSV